MISCIKIRSSANPNRVRVVKHKKIILSFSVAVLMATLFLVAFLFSGASAISLSANSQSDLCLDADKNFIFLDLEIGECEANSGTNIDTKDTDYIKWIDLNADYKSLVAVLNFCKEYYKNNNPQEFSEVLAFIATKNGNSFSSKTTAKYLNELRAKLKEGTAITDIYSNNKYFNYYVKAYSAIFNGIIGEFTRLGSEKTEYGISGFFPLAQGYHYNHYDDFGAKRGYGFSRKHLGHDFMGSTGTPIIAIEGGTITELGWNKYGGWRVGVRSHCSQRYYYYAHLRKDKPFAPDLKKGDTVFAGQVIGYLGNTGYSNKENTNLKTGNPHLHLGMQIIFHPAQEKGSKEIWLDLYALSKFLSSEKARTYKQDGHAQSKSIKQPVERLVEPIKR